MGSVWDNPVPHRIYETAPERKPAPRRTRLRLAASVQREIILALLLLFYYSFFRQIPAWNEWSRYDLTVAIVDDHTTRIDPYHQNTGDKAFYNGHYYSDKAPGSSLLAVPTYAFLRIVATLTGMGELDPNGVVQALTFTVAGLPTVLLAILLLRFLRALVGEGWALTMTGGYALGTIAFPFATMFFGHAASTSFLFGAFYSLWSARERLRWWQPFLAGSLVGWAVMTELPVALGAGVLFVYSLWLGRRYALLFIAGGLPLLAVLLLYNWLAFDNPLRIGYQYATVFGEQNKQGLIGVVLPKLATVAALLLEPRGLLHLSPWFMLVPLGLFAACRRSIRAELIVCGVICLLFLGYNAGALNPFGGWTPGPRYLLPALPFATVLVALAPRPFRPLIALQVVFSIVVVGIATATMPNAPEDVANPLGDLWVPRLMGRYLAETTAWLRWGVPGIQPLALLACAAGLALLGMYASTRQPRLGRWLTGLCGLLLAVTLAVFGLPLDLRATSAAGTPSLLPTPKNAAQIQLLDGGMTRIPQSDDRDNIAPWAQLVNQGDAVEHTRVVFEIYNANGEREWAAWHGDVAWQAHERKRLDVEWSPGEAAPGEYWLSIVVMSEDEQQIFARSDQVDLMNIYR